MAGEKKVMKTLLIPMVDAMVHALEAGPNPGDSHSAGSRAIVEPSPDPHALILWKTKKRIKTWRGVRNVVFRKAAGRWQVETTLNCLEASIRASTLFRRGSGGRAGHCLDAAFVGTTARRRILRRIGKVGCGGGDRVGRSCRGVGIASLDQT